MSCGSKGENKFSLSVLIYRWNSLKLQRLKWFAIVTIKTYLDLDGLEFIDDSYTGKASRIYEIHL